MFSTRERVSRVSRRTICYAHIVAAAVACTNSWSVLGSRRKCPCIQAMHSLHSLEHFTDDDALEFAKEQQAIDVLDGADVLCQTLRFG